MPGRLGRGQASDGSRPETEGPQESTVCAEVREERPANGSVLPGGLDLLLHRRVEQPSGGLVSARSFAFDWIEQHDSLLSRSVVPRGVPQRCQVGCRCVAGGFLLLLYLFGFGSAFSGVLSKFFCADAKKIGPCSGGIHKLPGAVPIFLHFGPFVNDFCAVSSIPHLYHMRDFPKKTPAVSLRRIWRDLNPCSALCPERAEKD